jgi:hypothetical protein
MKKKNSQKVAFMLGLVGLVALLSVIFGSYILNSTNVDNRASAATVRKTTSSTTSTISTDYNKPIAASITPYEGGKALKKGDNVVANKLYKISITMPPVGDYEYDATFTGVVMSFPTYEDVFRGDHVAGSLTLYRTVGDTFEGTFRFNSSSVGRYINVYVAGLRLSNGEQGTILTQIDSSYLAGGRVVAK